MIQPFLVSDVPGEVAAPLGVFAAGAMTAMGGLIKWLIGQVLDESRKSREVVHDLADAVRENTREIRESIRRAS